jgi:hypothetical protein
VLIHEYALWSGKTAPFFLNLGHQMEVSERLHAMANLPQGRETSVGPRADLDMMMERKISVPARNQNPILWSSK